MFRMAPPVMVGVALVALAAAHAAFAGSVGWGYDLAAYLAAADRLVRTGTPYVAETISGLYRPGPGGLYLYAPPFAQLMAPLLPLGAPASLWFVVRAVALAGACWLMPVGRTIRAASFLVGVLSLPTLLDLSLGNISLIVLLLCVIGWRARGRRLAGAALIVASTVRPPVLLPLLVLVLGARDRVARRRVLVGSALTALLVVAVSLLLAGPGPWLDYAAVLRHSSGFAGIPRNVDLASAALLWGVAQPWPGLLWLGGATLALVSTALATRRDEEAGYVVAVAATLLVSPLLWAHYLVLLLIPAAYVAHRRWPAAILLPLLGWLPEPLLPLAALAGLLLPLVAASAPATSVLTSPPEGAAQLS